MELFTLPQNIVSLAEQFVYNIDVTITLCDNLSGNFV